MALEWVFKTFNQPDSVAVMGWSAGAIASPLYTHIVAQQYPKAQVAHFADGAGVYLVGERLAPLLQAWGTADMLKSVPGFEDLDIRTVCLEDLYVRAAKLNPTITFHQYNEQHDAVQGIFLRLIVYIGGYYAAVLAINALDNRGRPHVLDRLCTRQTNGVRLDWFNAANAITNAPVEDVEGSDGKTSEYFWTRPKFPR